MYSNIECVIFDLGYFAQKDINCFSEIDGMKEFYSCEFDIGDIVRSGLVRSYIVQKYNTHLGDSE